VNYLPGLASNCDPSDLCFLSCFSYFLDIVNSGRTDAFHSLGTAKRPGDRGAAGAVPLQVWHQQQPPPPIAGAD
jgi:hypothetical protein